MEDNKENLEAARNWLKIAKEQQNEIAVKILEDLFPELTESEDEKIMKTLVGHLSECRKHTDSEVMLTQYAEWISWLEKKKVENKEAIKIRGWVARDECDNGLGVYTTKPHINEDLHMWENSEDWLSIDENYFPELQYNSEPIEVILEIKPLEK